MSMAKFTFYKISVELANKISLLMEDKPKHQVVLEAFDVEEPIIFQHVGVTLAYVKHKRVGDYIIGSLGRQSETEVPGPPSTGFETATQEAWPHVLVIINVSSAQPLGQTVAVMMDGGVFRRPLSPLKSLVDNMTHTNELLDGYELIPNSVSRQETFWDIIKTRTGRIQKLTFDLAAPNFLGVHDELSESLRGIRDRYNATKATIAIENPEGSLQIPRDDDFVEQAVTYATSGAGDIKLKAKEEGPIDAKRQLVTASIQSLDTSVIVESDNPETVKRICDTVFSCLKR